MGDFFSGENELDTTMDVADVKATKKRPSTSGVEALELPSAKKAKYVPVVASIWADETGPKIPRQFRSSWRIGACIISLLVLSSGMLTVG